MFVRIHAYFTFPSKFEFSWIWTLKLMAIDRFTRTWWLKISLQNNFVTNLHIFFVIRLVVTISFISLTYNIIYHKKETVCIKITIPFPKHSLKMPMEKCKSASPQVINSSANQNRTCLSDILPSQKNNKNVKLCCTFAFAHQTKFFSA